MRLRSESAVSSRNLATPSEDRADWGGLVFAIFICGVCRTESNKSNYQSKNPMSSHQHETVYFVECSFRICRWVKYGLDVMYLLDIPACRRASVWPRGSLSNYKDVITEQYAHKLSSQLWKLRLDWLQVHEHSLWILICATLNQAASRGEGVAILRWGFRFYIRLRLVRNASEVVWFSSLLEPAFRALTVQS